MRTIGVVTVARSDYGIYVPVLRRIQQAPELGLRLYVSGMHLSPAHGLTVRMIENDGYEAFDRIDMLMSSDTPEGIAKSLGMGVVGFSQSFARERPDVLLVLGDRFEMFAAALAALPYRIPVAHLHGGELTFGAIDDSLRHAMTKLSHLHFASTKEYAARIMQLGEEPWRVTVSGAPALDRLADQRLLSPQELSSRFQVSFEKPPLLVTFHPVTLEYDRIQWQMEQLLEALDAVDLPVIFTAPNADTQNSVVRTMIESYVRRKLSSALVDNFGSEAYFSAMACSAAMVGNSSSGIIEAPSFELPVVNIGIRQEGRVRAPNVIDVGYGSSEIRAGISRALSPEFHREIEGSVNPYSCGNAASVIVERLATVPLDERLILKRFFDQ
jgi:UDP-hydrolysing UDP-N-acetyl-D-glucosamine 2-epimerase